MTNQTQDYITLKPIAERFKEVASTISEDEIKALIKDELRTQIREQISLGYTLSEWVDAILEDEDDWINLLRSCLKENIKNAFK
jgi:ethanolamine ammonia-lyase large subunit